VSATRFSIFHSRSQPRWGPLAFSRAKALSIVALAAAIETGAFDVDAIESLDNEAAHRRAHAVFAHLQLANLVDQAVLTEPAA
jgi:hypothetical protein